MRALLPTISRGTKFMVAHFMCVIRRTAFNGLSSAIVVKGFGNTGNRLIDPSVSKIDRLAKGKGTVNVARQVDMEQLALRLGLEARLDIRGPVVSFGSVSIRGRAIGAMKDAMRTAMAELAAVAASKQAAKDKHQAAKTARAADSIAKAARDKVTSAQRRCIPAVVARRERLRRSAARARSAVGHFVSYVFARGAAVEVEPRPKRQRQTAAVMGMGGPG